VTDAACGVPPGTSMVNARIETSTAPDGSSVVRAIFDLSEAEVSCAAQAVNAARTERFRNEELSADAVLAMRELTALADELTSLAAHGSAVTLLLSPARLVALRDALDAFVAHRDEIGFTREEDREAYACAISLAGPLADLSADALRAALDSGTRAGC
jgi:hypothetical protein